MWKQGYISSNINEHITAYYYNGTWIQWKPEYGHQFVFWETTEGNDSIMSPEDVAKLEETIAELEKEMDTRKIEFGTYSFEQDKKISKLEKETHEKSDRIDELEMRLTSDLEGLKDENRQLKEWIEMLESDLRARSIGDGLGQ
jgi:hypothetical protein